MLILIKNNKAIKNKNKTNFSKTWLAACESFSPPSIACSL